MVREAGHIFQAASAVVGVALALGQGESAGKWRSLVVCDATRATAAAYLRVDGCGRAPECFGFGFRVASASVRSPV